ncbi:MAG: hypothetical protein ACRDN0_36040 [Trebonia sp.]
MTAAVAALGTVASAPTATAATPPSATAHATGVLTAGDGFSFTLQSAGRPVGVLNALTVAANRLEKRDYPYVWGGGHAEAGVASVGERGPGFNGHRRGYDCSGAVAAVLTGGGLWPVGMSVPNDAGVIRYLSREHLIARGAGRGARQVMLYDRPGVHIFMNIDGRFFGTSDGGPGGNRRGGPAWLDAGSDVTSRRFRRYHFVARALHARTSAGYTIGFEPAPSAGLIDYPVGTQLSVTYRTTASGMLVAQSVTAVGELTATATVQAIGPDGSSLTVTTSTGASLEFSIPATGVLAKQLVTDQLVAGDTVTIGYLGTPPAPLTLLTLTVTATPPASPAPPTTPTPAPPTTPTQTVVAPTPQTPAGGASGLGW